MAEEQGLTNRIISAAQRLEGGTASSLPYSPPRQTLSDPARPAVQPDPGVMREMTPRMKAEQYGPTSLSGIGYAFNQYSNALPAGLEVLANLTNVERARSEGMAANVAAAREVGERFYEDPGSVDMVSYAREVNAPFPAVTGTLADVALPGFGELSKLSGAVMGFRPSIVRNLFTGGVAQSIESADTSLSQVPGLFTWMRRTGSGISSGGVNLDIGGGRFDKASDFVREELGGTNFVFDPFNRSVEHNERVIDEIVSRGGADTVTVANVLNVIPEQDNQLRVIEQALEGLRPGGTAYFSVYTGDRSGIGRATSKGFQQNLPTADYVPLIESIFGADNVRRQGDIIIATRP